MYETKPKFDPKRGDIITYGNPMSTTQYTGLVMHANSELIVCARTNPEGVGPQDRNPQLKIRGVTEDLYVNPWGPTVGVKHFNVRGIVSHLDDKKYREIALAFLYAYLGLFYRVDGNKYILMNPSVKLDNPMSMMLSLMLGEDITDESKDETAEPTTTELIKTEPKSFVKPVIEKVIVDEIPEEKPEPEKPMSAIDKFNLRLSKTASLNPNVKKLKPTSTIINPLPFEPSPITTIAPPKVPIIGEADPKPAATTTAVEKKSEPDVNEFQSFTEVVAKNRNYKAKHRSDTTNYVGPVVHTIIENAMDVDPEYYASLDIPDDVVKRVDDVYDYFSDFIVNIDDTPRLSINIAYNYAFKGGGLPPVSPKKPKMTYFTKKQFIAIYLTENIEDIRYKCFVGSGDTVPSRMYAVNFKKCVRTLYTSYSSKSDIIETICGSKEFKEFFAERAKLNVSTISIVREAIERFPMLKHVDERTISYRLTEVLSSTNDDNDETIRLLVHRRAKSMGRVFTQFDGLEDIAEFIAAHYDTLGKYMDGTRDVGFKNDIPMRILTYAMIESLASDSGRNHFKFLQLSNNGIIIDFANKYTIREILNNDPRQYQPDIADVSKVRFWAILKTLSHFADTKNAREIKALKAHIAQNDFEYVSSNIYPLAKYGLASMFFTKNHTEGGEESPAIVFLAEKLDLQPSKLTGIIRNMPSFFSRKDSSGKHCKPFDVR